LSGSQFAFDKKVDNFFSLVNTLGEKENETSEIKYFYFKKFTICKKARNKMEKNYKGIFK